MTDFKIDAEELNKLRHALIDDRTIICAARHRLVDTANRLDETDRAIVSVIDRVDDIINKAKLIEVKETEKTE